MQLSNGWFDNSEWPQTAGDYHTISILHVKDPMKNPSLVVRDGDCVVETDYFDGSDWEKNPQRDFDNDGWEVVAWMPMTHPLLPHEFNNAVLWQDLPQRLSYQDEFLTKEA